MAATNLISIQDPIQQVITTFRPADNRWLPLSVSWAFDALQSIKCNAMLEPTSTLLEVGNFRREWPEDCIGILSLEYNGRKIVRDSDITFFDETPANNYNYVDIATINTGLINTIVVNLDLTEQQLKYNTYNNMIVLNHKEATVKLHYVRWCVDDKGCPLIPDLYNVKRLIYWHLIQNLLISGYKNDVINFNISEQKITEHMVLARREIKMPSFEEALLCLTTTTRLITPLLDAFDFNKNLSSLQIINK